MDDSFVNLVEYKAGCEQRLFKKKKKKKGSILTLLWQSGASESVTVKYVLLLVQVFAIDCSNAEFCT